MGTEDLHNDLQQIKTMLENIGFQSKEYYNVKEAAMFLNISESTLYKLTCTNSIVFYQPNGKLILFKKSDLIAYIEKGRRKTHDEIKEEAKERIKNFKSF